MSKQTVYHDEIPNVELFIDKPRLKIENFNKAYNRIDATPIVFQRKWLTEAGRCFGGLVNLDLNEVVGVVKYGDVFKTADSFGRKILVFVTQLGNVIVYQGYSGHTDAIQIEASPEFNGVYADLFTAGWLDYKAQAFLIGYNGTQHIGQRLNRLFAK